MRCRLKLRDTQNPKHQVHDIGESAAKLLWRVTPSVKHGYQLKFGDAFVAQIFKYQICVIGESAAKLCGRNFKQQACVIG